MTEKKLRDKTQIQTLPAKSQFLLYQTEDGQTRIEVRLQDESVWLSQWAKTELFQTSKQNISLHDLNNWAMLGTTFHLADHWAYGWTKWLIKNYTHVVHTIGSTTAKNF